MSTIKKILYIIACIVIISGVIVWKFKGFNLELQYSQRNQIDVANNTGMNINDIKQIVSEVLGNTRHCVQEIENFGNAISITADEITEEQRNQIVTKINEKYNIKINNNDIEIISVPFTRVKDIVKPFIIPGILTIVITILYFLLRFRKLSLKVILAKTVIIPIIIELLLYSIISITRIPFGDVSVAIGVGLYVVVIAILASKFEDDRENKLTESQEGK